SGDVVLIDDHAVSRFLARSFLGRAGFPVREHDRAEAALADLAVHPAALVVTDLQMPGMDGLAFIRRLRAMGGPAGRVPLIVLSAGATSRSARAALAAGADLVLDKPVDAEALIEAARRLVRRPAG
ncbi:MAG: response regulator, partial [Alphaproteobacteria bacterium]